MLRNQHRLRVFHQLLDPHEEEHGLLAVNQPVVVGERQIHHRADRDLILDNDRAFDDIVHPKDTALRRIEDRRRKERAVSASVGDRKRATREVVDAGLPFGVYHLAAQGECTWADFAEAIFEEAGVSCRVRRITTEELGRPAPRPAYSVLRSEKPGTPVLPHWRDGLKECLARLERG